MLLENFTVLYVEDNKNVQNSVKDILESEVKMFYQAYDGNEGLGLYKRYKPDIIVSDLNMPELCGFDMIEEIKKIDDTQHIILFTALHDVKFLQKAIDLKVDQFILKPLTDVNILFESLEKIALNLTNSQKAIEMETCKIHNEKMTLLVSLIKNISHHWRQPLSLISTLSSSMAINKEHNLNNTLDEIKTLNTITQKTQELSEILTIIDKIDLENADLENLDQYINIRNPIEGTLIK